MHVAKHIHARAPKLFTSRVALAVLSEMEDLEISRAHQTLAIGAADMETAQQPRHRPQRADGGGALRRHRWRGTVIYVGEITYPGDCVRLNIELIGEGRG